MKMTAERFAEIRQMLKIYENLKEKHNKCVEIGKASADDATSRQIEGLVTDIPENELREYKKLKKRNEDIWKALIKKAKSGEAKISSMRGVRPGNFINRAYRTFTLSESTGIKTEELNFFRATLTAEEKERLAREWAEAKGK